MLELAVGLTLLLSPDPARLRQALAHEQAGDDGRAKEALERLIRESPGWELARLEAGRLELKAGRALGAAEWHLDAARSLAPENPRVHYLWGLLQVEKGRLDEAQRSFEIAVHYRPEFPEARLRLAGLHVARQAWRKAEAQYRAVLAADPGDVGSRMQLAAMLERQSRNDEAEREWLRLIAGNPSLPAPKRKLAELYERTGRHAQADQLRRSLEPPKKKMRQLKKSRR